MNILAAFERRVAYSTRGVIKTSIHRCMHWKDGSIERPDRNDTENEATTIQELKKEASIFGYNVEKLDTDDVDIRSGTYQMRISIDMSRSRIRRKINRSIRKLFEDQSRSEAIDESPKHMKHTGVWFMMHKERIR